jgi:type I restriction enzyme M protein
MPDKKVSLSLSVKIGYDLCMANERKTENLIREHLKNSDVLIVEEQQSDNQRIKKLLKQASKSGNGAGYPEFICQFKENPDLLIVVECKPDIRKHESKTRDNPKDFAVDGTLLYSSYLSKEYDVIAIGVSGETASELKVSHFLQLKGESVAVEKFDDKLLSAEDYLEGYEKSPEKFRQDYQKLLTFSAELNKKLHGYKILESDRSLLISCILIALENKAFVKSYKDYAKAEDLARFLVDTVIMEFKNALIQEDKLNILKNRYGFINSDTSLSTVDGVLQEIITDIDDNINKFIKSHEYYDVLGQLYIEFLRYANSDKGLGIVLTPPHITEFMSQVGEVNKDSVVYDNCTGTGGFLVSAMSLMIEDAKGDQEKIKEIKKSQLVGVEFQAHIFALACSNMFIHQDGKTSILKGSCFDEDIILEAKTHHPTVGLLNPPYKADKKKDIEELEFVLNNLECLEQGGKCVAIVPMATALAQKGKVLELKRKLLKRHTLEAVFSMPDELFFNSKVGVVSCIMVFTAKRPHPSGKSTFFGYFKNDGYVKRKIKGRIDLFDRFKDIKARWLKAYFNKEEIPGLSVNQVVTPEDEWCAEAYMETDYGLLSDDAFIREIRKYTASQITKGIL